MADDWYSDHANAQLAEIKRKEAAGEPGSWLDWVGILEPRIPAKEHERCDHCGSDAREPSGGDGLFCGLCLNRDRDEDYTRAELDEMRAHRKARAGQSEEVA